jgi:hypothetical protein
VTSPSKSDVVVTLTEGTRTVAEAVAQIKPIAELDETAKKPGVRVFVRPEPARAGGMLGRLFGGKKSVSRGVRASALLARGYVDIAAGEGEADGVDWVWASASKE